MLNVTSIKLLSHTLKLFLINPNYFFSSGFFIIFVRIQFHLLFIICF